MKCQFQNYLIRFTAFDQDKHGNPTELGSTTLTFDDFRDFTLQKLILSCSLQEPVIVSKNRNNYSIPSLLAFLCLLFGIVQYYHILLLVRNWHRHIWLEFVLHMDYQRVWEGTCQVCLTILVCKFCIPPRMRTWEVSGIVIFEFYWV